MKAIITTLLIILSTSCFSLLFTNVVNCLTQQETTASTTDVYNFDRGYFVKAQHSFWEILGNVIFGTGLSTNDSEIYYNSYDSYEISSITGLNNFAASVAEGFNFAEKTVTLTTDLDYSSSTFIPIGYTLTKEGKFDLGDAGFNGTFDGGGHVVSNISISGSNVSNDSALGDCMPCGLGFFAILGDYLFYDSSQSLNLECVVKSLQISNMEVTAPAYNAAIGGIAGATYNRYYEGTSFPGKNSISIENCVVTDLNVSTGSNKNYYMGVGGLVGCTILFTTETNYNVDYVQITNCIVNDMNITGSTDNYDSIVALSPGLGILRCDYEIYLQFWYNLTNCLTNVSYDSSLSISGSNIPTICSGYNYYDNGFYLTRVDPPTLTSFPGLMNSSYDWTYIHQTFNSDLMCYNNEATSGVFDGNNISYAIYDTVFCYSISNYTQDGWSCTGGADAVPDYDYNSDTGYTDDYGYSVDKCPWFMAYYDAGDCLCEANKLYLKTFLTEVSIDAENGTTSTSTALVPKGSSITEISLSNCFQNEMDEVMTDYHVLSSSVTLDNTTTSSILCIDAYYISNQSMYYQIGTFKYIDDSTSEVYSNRPVYISLFDYCLATADSDIYEFQVWEINEKSYVAHFVDTSRIITFEAESNTDKTTSATYKIKIGSRISVRTSDTQCQFSFTDATGKSVTYTYTLNSTATTKYMAGYVVNGKNYNSTSSDRITISANTTLSARIETKSYNIGFG